MMPESDEYQKLDFWRWKCANIEIYVLTEKLWKCSILFIKPKNERSSQKFQAQNLFTLRCFYHKPESFHENYSYVSKSFELHALNIFWTSSRGDKVSSEKRFKCNFI